MPVVRSPGRRSRELLCLGLQEEIDYFWEKLSKGGDPKAQQCGWLKDRYGLSWQIVPAVLPEMLKDHESPKAQRAMEAVLRMKKLDIDELERAFAGSEPRPVPTR